MASSSSQSMGNTDSTSARYHKNRTGSDTRYGLGRTSYSGSERFDALPWYSQMMPWNWFMGKGRSLNRSGGMPQFGSRYNKGGIGMGIAGDLYNMALLYRQGYLKYY